MFAKAAHKKVVKMTPKSKEKEKFPWKKCEKASLRNAFGFSFSYGRMKKP